MKVVAASRAAVPVRKRHADVGPPHAVMSVADQSAVELHIDPGNAVASQRPTLDQQPAGDRMAACWLQDGSTPVPAELARTPRSQS